MLVGRSFEKLLLVLLVFASLFVFVLFLAFFLVLLFFRLRSLVAFVASMVVHGGIGCRVGDASPWFFVVVALGVCVVLFGLVFPLLFGLCLVGDSFCPLGFGPYRRWFLVVVLWCRLC